MRRKNYSRLSKRLEDQTKRNLILIIAGIIIFFGILFQFGFPLLANFAGFISSFSKENQTVEENKDEFVIAPILDSLPVATGKSEIEVKGQASKGHKISLFVDNTLSDFKEAENDGSFSFKIFLKQGENKIKAQASAGENKSEYSEEEIVIFKNKAPKLEIESPSDGQKFEKDQNQAEIKGTTDEGVKITVNDFWAQMNDDNSFSYSFILQNGDNNIKIIAMDEAGNKTEKTLKVIYSP